MPPVPALLALQAAHLVRAIHALADRACG